MESVRGYARFFFTDASQRISAVIDYARKRYPNLFDGYKSNRRNTPQASFRYIVGRTIEDRDRQLCGMCDFEPGKIEIMKRAPIIDFYMILNSRIEETKKLNKLNKK